MAPEQRPRGGARPGTGPKPKPDSMVTRAFVITREDDQRLIGQSADTGDSKSEIVRHALRLYWSQMR